MLAASPEVVMEYRRRYPNAESVRSDSVTTDFGRRKDAGNTVEFLQNTPAK
jgi:hypothetical protein